MWLRRKIKSILLVDFDNVEGHVGKPFGDSIANWKAWLEDGGFEKRPVQRDFLAMRVYWNGRTDKRRASFEAEEFEAFACRPAAVVKIKEGKSSADVVITIDAMDLAHELRGLKEVILLTADTDFVPLVDRLQEKGLHVVAMGNESDPSSAIYRDRADTVISVGALREACRYRRPQQDGKSAATASPELVKAEDVAPVREAPTNPIARPRKQRTDFDLEMAARLVIDLAMQSPNRGVSRASVERVVSRVPGFTKVPTKQAAAWLGCRDYEGMLQALVKLDSRLAVARPKGGGVQVRYVGAIPNMDNAPPEAAV